MAAVQLRSFPSSRLNLNTHLLSLASDLHWLMVHLQTGHHTHITLHDTERRPFSNPNSYIEGAQYQGTNKAMLMKIKAVNTKLKLYSLKIKAVNTEILT